MVGFATAEVDGVPPANVQAYNVGVPVLKSVKATV